MQTYIVANHILRYGNKKHNKHLTCHQLVLIIYFMHGWYLSIKDTPLINDEFVASHNEPSLPLLQYNQSVKKHGHGPISQYINGAANSSYEKYFDPKLEEDGTFIQILEKVWEYVMVPGHATRRYWCGSESAWTLTRKSAKISNLLIRQSFNRLARQHQGIYESPQSYWLIPSNHEHILPRPGPKESS